MEQGFNHDIPVGGSVYHVQTEQVQHEGAVRIVTEVYDQGRVIARYGSPVLEHAVDRKSLVRRIRGQHKETIQWLLAGRPGSLETVLLAAGSPSGTSRSAGFAKPRKGRPHGWLPKLARVTPHHSSSQDLGLRRAMIRFVRAVGDDVPESPEHLRRRLQSLTTAIAMLLGQEGDRRLRGGELAELVMRRSEAKQFLGASTSAEADSETGLALWRSFAELARTFSAINDRSSLREHDLEALCRVVSIWLALPDRSVPPDPTSMALLESCWGRDSALDALLDDRRGLTVETLLPEVGRVADELRRTNP